MSDKEVKEMMNLSDKQKLFLLANYLRNKKKGLYKYPDNLLFKDFKPKYRNLEVIYDVDEKNDYYGKMINKVIRYDKVVKRFGDKQVLSYIDYEDTKTTSVRLSKWDTFISTNYLNMVS